MIAFASASSARATAACKSSARPYRCRTWNLWRFADIYTRRLEDVKKIAPNAKTYLDYRRLLEDKSIDAVLIATPQHLHCEHFTAALDAGKHVYQEKTMAFTVDHAKRMRAAYQKGGGKRIVQIGHQCISSGHVADAVEFTEAGTDGQDHRASTRTCTAIRRTANRSGRGPCIPT